MGNSAEAARAKSQREEKERIEAENQQNLASVLVALTDALGKLELKEPTTSNQRNRSNLGLSTATGGEEGPPDQKVLNLQKSKKSAKASHQTSAPRSSPVLGSPQLSPIQQESEVLFQIPGFDPPKMRSPIHQLIPRESEVLTQMGSPIRRLQQLPFLPSGFSGASSSDSLLPSAPPLELLGDANTGLIPTTGFAPHPSVSKYLQPPANPEWSNRQRNDHKVKINKKATDDGHRGGRPNKLKLQVALLYREFLSEFEVNYIASIIESQTFVSPAQSSFLCKMRNKLMRESQASPRTVNNFDWIHPQGAADLPMGAQQSVIEKEKEMILQRKKGGFYGIGLRSHLLY